MGLSTQAAAALSLAAGAACAAGVLAVIICAIALEMCDAGVDWIDATAASAASRSVRMLRDA